MNTDPKYIWKIIIVKIILLSSLVPTFICISMFALAMFILQEKILWLIIAGTLLSVSIMIMNAVLKLVKIAEKTARKLTIEKQEHGKNNKIL